MKRRFSVCLALLLLLMTVLAAIPAHAAEDISWATLEYSYDPVEEGGTVETGRIKDGLELVRGATITCDTTKATMKLDGATVESGSVYLSKAGRYVLTVAQKDQAQNRFDYEVTVLPVVNVYNGQIFHSYPTIVCENVQSMVLNKGKDGWDRNFTSGTTVRQLGAQTLEFHGTNCVFNISFSVMLCTSERVFDEATGKESLKITVGEFQDETLEVMLDGSTPLTAGTYMVSAVGQHTLDAKLNGTAVTNLSAMPFSTQLNLQIELTLDSKDLRAPCTFRFSVWDAQVYVNGKLVKGDYRMEKGGEHVIEVRDASGKAIKDAILFHEGAAAEGESCTQLTLTFKNPHNVYVIFLILPTLALLGVAVYFLVMRRRIV